MIVTRIWKGGTDSSLDKLFDDLREENFNDTHPLQNNYTAKDFELCDRLSITFDNDNPVCCSSIIKRTCWPLGAYRILNRFWKVSEERIDTLNTSTRMLRVTDSIKAQQDHAFKHLNARLVFISRKENHWQKLLIKSINNNTGYKWNKGDQLYQTCDLDSDICYQNIIYFGDMHLLKFWNKK